MSLVVIYVLDCVVRWGFQVSVMCCSVSFELCLILSQIRERKLTVGFNSSRIDKRFSQKYQTDQGPEIMNLFYAQLN